MALAVGKPAVAGLVLRRTLLLSGRPRPQPSRASIDLAGLFAGRPRQAADATAASSTAASVSPQQPLPPPPPARLVPPAQAAEDSEALSAEEKGKQRQQESRSVLDQLAAWQAAQKRLTPLDISWAMKELPRLTVEDKVLSPELAEYVLGEAASAKGKWSPTSLSRCANALRFWSGLSQKRILSVLQHKLVRMQQPFSATQISMTLGGFGRCADGPDLRRALAAIALKVESCPASFSSKEISQCLSGLRQCGDCDDTRLLLAALLTKLHANVETFPAELIGSCFYALRRCNSGPESLAVLAALTQKLQRCQDEFVGQGIASVLYGLQGFGDSAELRTALAAIRPHITDSVQFKSYELCMSLMGLEKCTSDNHEALAVVEALVPHAKRIDEETETMRDNMLHMAFAGLRGFGGGSPAVSEMVGVLSPHVQRVLPSIPSGTLGLICRTLKEIGTEDAEQLLKVVQPWEQQQTGTRQRSTRHGRSWSSSGSEAQRSNSHHGAERLGLPEGWSEHRQGDRVYYHHPQHGSSWSRPGLALPDGWTAHTDPVGRTFYHHESQGSSWEFPGSQPGGPAS